MSRRADVLVSFGVAAAVAGTSLVLGRLEAAVPQAAVTKVRAAPEKDAGAKAKAPAKAAVKAGVVEKKAAKEAVRDRVVVKRAFAVQLGAVPNDQVQQFVQQFRPMVRTEYYFIRNVCDLTKDQRKEVAREGEHAVLAAARRFAEEQQKMMRGGWRPGTEQPDPHRLLEEVLTKTVPPLLTSAQAVRYKEELEKRAASRKQAALDNLVAKLDQDLVLDSDQREKISSSLSSHWNDAWCQSLQMLMNIENFFPNVPDNLIVPFLTEHQRSSWQRIPKNQNVFFGFAFNGMAENDPLDDPELAEARREAEAAAEAKANAKAAGNEPRKP